MRHLLPFAALLLLCSCDPPGDLYDAGAVAITARVINPNPVISLGDSVAFYFAVPDSVILNGTRIAISAGNNDGATIGFFKNRILAAKASGFETDTKSCQTYANPGSLTANGTLTFTSRNGKLLGRFYMIPKQKGIYFLEQAGMGYMDLNNHNLSLRFSIDFGKINRNHQLLIDSAGTTSRFNQFLQGRISQGYEVYGFRVI
jgi:hypothetical protein